MAGHAGMITDVAFSPDGGTLATGSVDGTAKLWDMSNGLERLTLTGHNSLVVQIAYGPDGTWLATVIRLVSDEGATFTIIGKVDDIDPWIVSGLTLTVDDNTLIDDDVEMESLRAPLAHAIVIVIPPSRLLQQAAR